MLAGPTGDAALDMFDRATARFSDLIADASDPDAPVPSLEWTIGETGAHVLAALRHYQRMLEGAPGFPDIEHIDRYNAELIAAIPERAPGQLATAIREEARAARGAVVAHLDDRMAWHAGIEMPVSCVAAMLANDVLIHGWDIAGALGRRWEIAPADSITGTLGVVPILTRFIDKDAATGLTTTYVIALRGGPDVRLEFVDGALTLGEGAHAPVDCKISADPTAWNLLGYGRIPAWRPMLKGQLVVTGRRPWRIAKFASLIRNP